MTSTRIALTEAARRVGAVAREQGKPIRPFYNLLWQLATNGVLPAERAGRQILIDESDLPLALKALNLGGSLPPQHHGADAAVANV